MGLDSCCLCQRSVILPASGLREKDLSCRPADKKNHGVPFHSVIFLVFLPDYAFLLPAIRMQKTNRIMNATPIGVTIFHSGTNPARMYTRNDIPAQVIAYGSCVRT